MKRLFGESLVPVVVLLGVLIAGVFLLGSLAETESRAPRVVRITAEDLEQSTAEAMVVPSGGRTDRTERAYTARDLLAMESGKDSVGTGLLGQAMRMAANDSLVEALAIVENILVGNPNHGSAWFARGSILSRRGMRQDAILAYENAVEYSGGETKAIPLYNLGCLYRDLGDVAKGEELFREAINRRPAYLLARFNLAVLLSKQSETREDAYRAYEQLLRLNPDYGEAYFNRGVMRMQDGQLDSAVVDFERTVEADSSFAKAWYNLGRLTSESGQADQAVAYYRRAVQADPENPKARLNLAIVLGRQDRYEEAAIVGAETVEKYPSYASALYNLAIAYSHTDQNEKARETYEKVLKLEPYHARAWQNLGVLHARAKRSEKAIECYKEALALDPSNLSARYNLALQLRRGDDLVSAAQEVARLLRLDPANSKALKFLGTTLRRLSRKDPGNPIIKEMKMEFKVEVADATH